MTSGGNRKPAKTETEPDGVTSSVSRSPRSTNATVPDWVLRGSENLDPAATVLDDGQDVHLGAVEQVGGEEVQRQDRLCLGSQESGPARAVAAGRGADAGVLEDLVPLENTIWPVTCRPSMR